jgi:alkanesulfonate monooxygenase SsuD/methylene tetrahydromethanopterin reductase-like flavin-dependent oxidoreductase (luciferase family)
MVLNAFIHATGHHVAAWRHPQSQADAGINFRHYVELAQTAERAKFHAMFLADSLAVRDQNVETASRAARYIVQFEPLTLLAGLAATIERLGLISSLPRAKRKRSTSVVIRISPTRDAMNARASSHTS